MKRTQNLRTLEELWEIEDQYPLVNSNPAGLLRWMFATGRVPESVSPNRDARRPRRGSSRRGNNHRS